jgi:hypothetical protein
VPDPATEPAPVPSEPVAEQFADADLARLRVNELGKVMIIMYHDIQDREGEWVRSSANLRKDLQRFYDLGYSLIPLSDYLTGDIDTAAGKPH